MTPASPRYVFSSSCSLYGAAGDGAVTEDSEFNPVTPYGVSKVMAEQRISKFADDRFSPTYLRNATAYGSSPRLRADIVVNNLTGAALTRGEVRLQSDGSPWRPLVHVEDISRAFLAVLSADRELVHDQAFNVGRDEDVVQIRTIADGGVRDGPAPPSPSRRAPRPTSATTVSTSARSVACCRPSSRRGRCRQASTSSLPTWARTGSRPRSSSTPSSDWSRSTGSRPPGRLDEHLRRAGESRRRRSDQPPSRQEQVR